MGRLRIGKFLLALSFSVCMVISTVALGATATASPQWCEQDPVLLVNGALVDVTTTFPAEYLSAIKDPVAFELLVPSIAIAAVVALPGSVPLALKLSKSVRAAELP